MKTLRAIVNNTLLANGDYVDSSAKALELNRNWCAMSA